ncbi:MAG TPA: molybdopterin cofactor-binding domain-containing protein [Pirellulales bacterium]|nr:molybdopterin cofactor-binding domain-containing protein [Pirellulales bacterium]
MKRDLITDEPVEDERFELVVGPGYDFSHSRRTFVEVFGAGMLIAISARRGMAQVPQRRGGFNGGGGAATVGSRIVIGIDGAVTVLTGKVEVGQGARTQLRQAAAEELRLPVESVRIEMGDTEQCPNDGGTSGSGTTPRTVPSVRTAAAVARQILLELAAEKLQADASALSVKDGRILSPQSNRSITYAELAQDQALKAKLASTTSAGAALTAPDDWQVLGKPAAKADLQNIVTGAHRYPSDIVLPDMLYGRVLRRPAYGASLKSIDLSRARAMPGVTVVRDGEFVGCAANSSWLAAKATDELSASAQWELADPAKQPTSENIFDYLKQHAASSQATSGRGPGRGGTSKGMVDQGLADSHKTLTAAYDVAYIQHAPLEPRAAVAQWHDGKLTVWTGTQNPMRVRGELMEAFKLSADQVRVIVPDTGGAFGGKHTGECALEAARLAKGCGKPVSLRWTRAEEFTWAYFRPAALIEVAGGLTEQGNLHVWKFTNYHAGGSALETPYDVPNVRTQFIACDGPLRVGSYRALAATANTFARECFMDELAAATNVDPLHFRLQHLPQGRLRDVLVAATDKFAWAARCAKHTADVGIGLACGTEKGSYVAACVEVQIDRRTGTVKVNHICQAFDCGAVQNPDNLRSQVEGGIVMGLGAALRERIEFADGKIRNGSFADYLVPRMDDLPTIDTILVNRRDLPSAGAGETPVIAVAPAIANAVFHAIGIRVRSMPLRAELLKQSV